MILLYLNISRTFVFLATVFSLTLSRDCFALSCIPTEVKSSYAKADVVFTGEVSALSDDGMFTFKILRAYKGDVKDRTEVQLSAWDRGAYKTGDRLLIFAEIEKRWFRTRLIVPPCGRVHLLATADDVLMELEGITFR
jgi:hypothetical protein